MRSKPKTHTITVEVEPVMPKTYTIDVEVGSMTFEEFGEGLRQQGKEITRGLARMATQTHAICERCWRRNYPGQSATKFRDEYRSLENCCFCGNKHESGIYVREKNNSPKLKHCEGDHDES